MEKLAEAEGIIFKIKRFSVHDGPGIRTCIFLKGCPLSCIWCHSPEGISPEITIWYDKSLCIACSECVKACPNVALELIKEGEHFIHINRNLCRLTGFCVNICPTGAIQFNGSKTSVSALINKIKKDILYYRVSGGGVTLTGGEPLFQPDFSSKILEACRKNGIHTAIETCLFCERENLSRITDFVDLFIVDLKIFNQVQHVQFTGKSNMIIKENLKYISGKGIPVIVRIPLIKGITDTDTNKNSCTRFVNEIDKRIPVEYLSYNPLAGNNYKRLDIPFLLE